MAVPISKTVTQSTGLKIKRITGLDPTLAAFYDNSLNEPLSAKHAEFVDIIHTDAGIMGQGISSGSIDFWPNNGNSLQPGCLHKINEPYSDNGNQLKLLNSPCSDKNYNILYHNSQIYAVIDVPSIIGLKVFQVQHQIAF